jgi:Na+-driven multidrug efflux pump
MLTSAVPTLGEVARSWKHILFIGIPTAATRVIVPLSIGVITRLVAAYGTGAVAGFGVASRIEFFALTTVRALSAVLMPFVGQNWGARKIDRVAGGASYSEKISLGWGGLMFAVLALAARPIASIFNENPDVVSAAALYLRVVPLGYGMYGIVILVVAVLNALNRPLHAAAISLFHMFALYVPLAILGSHFFGLAGIFAGLAISFLAGGAGAHLLMTREIGRQRRFR